MDLIDLVRKHAEQKQKEGLTPEITLARSNWFVNEVKALFDSIERWLEPVTKEKLVKFDRKPLPINEGMLGEYTTQQATITLDNEVLEMIPLGTIIFGSFGRIDVKGPRGQLMLILNATPGTGETAYVPKDASWSIVKREGHSRFRSEFNEESFGKLFADLFGIDAI
jgi:hypothetical protein